MKTYVEKAIKEAKKQHGQIHAQDLKALVDQETDWRAKNKKWRDMNQYIKDEPMVEGDDAFFPVGKWWMYNPTIGHLMMWVDSVLTRHHREIERVCMALRLPRYRNTRQAKNGLT